jgi:hypothetical protein
MLPSLRSITEGFKELTQTGPEANSFFEEFGIALKVLAVSGIAAIQALIEGFDTLYTVLKEIGLLYRNLGGRNSRRRYDRRTSG